MTARLMTQGYLHTHVSFSMEANSSTVTHALPYSAPPLPAAVHHYNANVMDLDWMLFFFKLFWSAQAWPQ